MNWLTARLDSDWQSWRTIFRRYSVRLAAVSGTLATIITGNRDLALSLLDQLPHGGFARILCAVIIGLAVFVVPSLTVWWKQPPNA